MIALVTRIFGKILSVALRAIKNLTVIALFTLAALFISMEAPQIHDQWLRSVDGPSILSMNSPWIDGSGKLLGYMHGTGFAIRGGSGKIYILTNRHVCDASPDGTLLISGTNIPDMVRLKIIAMSPTTDLCLVEAGKGTAPLTMARSLAVGAEVTVLGYASRFPLTETNGEAVGVMPYYVSKPMNMAEADSACTKFANNKITMETSIFGPQKFCTTVLDRALVTTAHAIPGNSGSPLLNNLGQVVGIIMGMDTEAAYGIAIPLTDVKHFLAQY